MKPFVKITALGAGLLSMGGCLATQEDMDLVHHQLNAINTSLARVTKNQAQMSQQLEEMSKSYGTQADNFKDLQQQMSKLSARLDDVNLMFNEVVSDSKTKSAIVLPSQIYAQAYSHLMYRNYDRAIEGFQLYLDKFPGGELSDTCLYYLGNAYEGKGDWKNAGLSYAKVLSKYTGSEYTAAARLKYAQMLLKLGGKNEEAKIYLKYVIKDFPYSNQAAIAKAELEKLEPPAPKEEPQISSAPVKVQESGAVDETPVKISSPASPARTAAPAAKAVSPAKAVLTPVSKTVPASKQPVKRKK
ncbi:MAG: tetratricopeptide repeat protein [Elusimicrobiaceae bacterium]